MKSTQRKATAQTSNETNYGFSEGYYTNTETGLLFKVTINPDTKMAEVSSVSQNANFSTQVNIKKFGFYTNIKKSYKLTAKFTNTQNRINGIPPYRKCNNN